jgi:GNAT superfamily N-acetyltransferase
MNSHDMTKGEVEYLVDPDARSAACAHLIAQLPAWFGLPDANASYIAGVADKPAFAVRGVDGQVIGMLSLRVPFPNNADIYWVGVAPDRHRQGLGRRLVDAALAHAQEIGCNTMTVETLGPSDPDEGYARTRKFYEAMGFKPLFELFPNGPVNPMLYMGRPV